MKPASAGLLRATALALLLSAGAVAEAQVSVGISLPSVRIGVNVPVYPQLERVPGYPVYWSPRGEANYFFHDGLYWVYLNDTWYHSGWYDGPWRSTEPYAVPVYLLRVPALLPPAAVRRDRGHGGPSDRSHQDGGRGRSAHDRGHEEAGEPRRGEHR